MKKLPYTEMSARTCSVCGKALKQNLINKHPNASLCYRCHRIMKGKPAHHVPRRKRIDIGLPVHNHNQIA